MGRSAWRHRSSCRDYIPECDGMVVWRLEHRCETIWGEAVGEQQAECCKGGAQEPAVEMRCGELGHGNSAHDAGPPIRAGSGHRRCPSVRRNETNDDGTMEASDVA